MLQLTAMAKLGHVLQGMGCTPGNDSGKDVFCQADGVLQQVHTRFQGVLHAEAADQVGLFHHNLQATQSLRQPSNAWITTMHNRVWVSRLLICYKQTSNVIELANWLAPVMRRQGHDI